MSGKREIKQGASHRCERASPSRIEERDHKDHDHAGEGGGRKSADDRDDDAHDPAEHTASVLQASWMPTASVAAKTTSAMVIGPPTLDCGTAPLD